MARLRTPVDELFDNVEVLTKEDVLRKTGSVCCSRSPVLSKPWRISPAFPFKESRSQNSGARIEGCCLPYSKFWLLTPVFLGLRAWPALDLMAFS